MSFPNSLHICSLASGSRGNSLLVEGPEGALLVDAGLSARELMRRVCLVGMDPARIRGILVTHEHEDHIRGVSVLSRRLHLPVFTTSGTCAAAGLSRECPVNAVTPGVDFHLAGFSISPFSIPHDAADPAGFVLSLGSRKIGIATDLGYGTSLVRKRLEGCDFLLLESNHDEKMLLEGPYPWFLKQRIRSRTGHLSNGASSGLLETLSHSGLQWVVLGHLSETNNTPDLALETAMDVIGGGGRGAKIHVAGMALPTPVFRLEL